jgi:hypothetical protein
MECSKPIELLKDHASLADFYTFGSTLIFTNGGKSAPLVLAANNHD